MTLPRLVFAVIAIWLVAAVSIWFALPDWTARGQFGDLFGSVNALFSGLAFAGLYTALRLQHDQLALQRNELKLQREELRLQREEMTASRAELANQVAAQTALFRASAAQITVASTQARIEAIKMKSEQFQPHARNPLIEEIEELAKALSALSARIEGNNRNVG